MKNFILTFFFCSIFSFVIAQNDTAVIVHEWGTFTTLCGSDGSFLSGLQREEEHLPPFTQSLIFSKPGEPIPDKGWPTFIRCQPTSVKVKMETPVLYFYAKNEIDFKINVRFNKGVISQWYPTPTVFTPDINSICKGTPIHVGGINGEIEWEGKVLAPNTTDTLTEPAKGWHTWLAPRVTKSNLIKSHKGEVEKYLFYRGMGSFHTQLTLNFDRKGKLQIANHNKEVLSFAMVYSKTNKGAEVWWMGKIGAKQKVEVLRAPMHGKTVEECMDVFISELVKAGLYEDEAKAMLDTWEKNYFETNGVKVFWIVPRYLTDEILPLKMRPVPQKLERVLVGRSEILTPEFEDEMYEKYLAVDHYFYRDTVYGWDRYKLAYDERFVQLKDEGYKPTNSDKIFYYIYPNPTNSILNIFAKIGSNGTEGKIRITDYTGKIVFSESVLANEQGEIFSNYNLANYTAGVYIISIISDNEVHTERVIVSH